MIPLYVHDGVAHVWNAKDWDTLRSNYRICGALIGSVASYPRQNDFLGLPLALMSEEATLLVEKGLCELVDLPNINEKPSSELKNKIEETEKRVLIEQMEAFRKRKVEQISQKIDIIVAGKKQKLLSKGITDVNLDKQVLLQEEINKLPDLSPAHALVHLPTEIIKETEKRNVTVAVLKPSVLDHDGGIRYSIFKDLWEQGHYITQGSKFGSDFLVYPGDPVRFHAAYMVRCICNQATQFSPSSLVAFGRLSVAVNKMAVLASCNVFGNIEYQTLQWHDGAIGCSGDF